MFDDDNAARNALQTLNDEPAPPPVTTIDQVLRRGRRRVFVQRASAVAGVVAVVAAIGVTAVLLRQGAPGGGDVRVAESTPPPAPTEPSAPTWPLPGWQQIEISEKDCEQPPSISVPGTPPDTLLPEAVVKGAFTSAIEAVRGPLASAVTTYWEEYSPKAEGPRGYVEAEVPMDNGNGQLQLEVVVYPGTPAAMADADMYGYRDCRPLARRVLPDGTVMQMFQADTVRPEQPMQHLQIFRPDGREYIVTVAGWSEADMVPAAGGGEFVDGGRGKLPTTDEQLAGIATKLVANLG